MNEDQDELTELGSSSIDLPEMVNPFPFEKDYVPQTILSMKIEQVGDYNDMAAINQAIDTVRIAMFKINENLRVAEAKVASAKIAYDRNYNRSYILASDAKTEGVRKAIAQIKSEAYENKLVVRQDIVRELIRRTRLMANELEALKTLSYNVRKEMDSSR